MASEEREQRRKRKWVWFGSGIRRKKKGDGREKGGFRRGRTKKHERIRN